jgi:hypothetical protein
MALIWRNKVSERMTILHDGHLALECMFGIVWHQGRKARKFE